MQILSLVSPQPTRISVTTDSVPSTTPGDYVLSRPDNGPNVPVVNFAFLTGVTTVELALSGPLQDGIAYQVTMPNAPGAPTGLVGYRTPLILIQPNTPGEDPEAEAFGVDMDWFSDTLTADGDIPQVRGKQCVINDLVAMALVAPGEIFHRPLAGAGMKLRVNGPGTATEISSMTAKLKRVWAEDGRVRQNGISLQTIADGSGQVQSRATVQLVAVDDTVAVKVPGGAT